VTKKEKIIMWFKKMGLIGFLFFLIKGLLWLLLPSLIAYWWAK
jgi:hypothetical protein